MRVKVIIRNGITADALATAQVDLEGVDIGWDYEDYDALLRYEKELRQDPGALKQGLRGHALWRIGPAAAVVRGI